MLNNFDLLDLLIERLRKRARRRE
jgi:hypothetical protein